MTIADTLERSWAAQEEAEEAERLARLAYDIIDGICVERDMSYDTSWVGMKFGAHLTVHADSHGGDVAGADGGFQIFPDSSDVKFPDASYVSPGRLDDRPTKGWLKIPPDLVVEVTSPSDKAGAVEAKRQAWLDAGVRRVWVAYPETRRVYAFADDGTVRAFGPDDILVDTVVPGFAVPVEKFFPAPAVAEARP